MEQLRQIGRGRQCEVLVWDEQRVVKLFFPSTTAEFVRKEYQNTKLAKALGLPVPGAYQIVQLDGRLGIVYDHISGVTMEEGMGKTPYKVLSFAAELAKLHAQIHRHQVSSKLTPLKERLLNRLQSATFLSSAQQDRLFTLLSVLPEGTAVCHGDFHPGNVILMDKGQTVIDWADATVGCASGDVARTILLLNGAVWGNYSRSPWERRIIRLFSLSYRIAYQRITKMGTPKISKWLPVLAAARLSEGVKEEEDYLESVLKQYSIL